MKEQTERGYGKVLTGEGGRNFRSYIKSWLQWMHDESVPTTGYMLWMEQIESWLVGLSHVDSVGRRGG